MMWMLVLVLVLLTRIFYIRYGPESKHVPQKNYHCCVLFSFQPPEHGIHNFVHESLLGSITQIPGVELFDFHAITHFFFIP